MWTLIISRSLTNKEIKYMQYGMAILNDISNFKWNVTSATLISFTVLSCTSPQRNGIVALLNRLSFPSRGTVIPVAFVKKPSGPATDRRWDLHRQPRLSTQQGREAHIAGGYRPKTNTSPNRKETTRSCWEIRETYVLIFIHRETCYNVTRLLS